MAPTIALDSRRVHRVAGLSSGFPDNVCLGITLWTRMQISERIKRLSHWQRTMLVDHVGSRQVVAANRTKGGTTTSAVRKSLLATGLLRYGHIPYRKHVRCTELTDLGREVVAAVLGEYADALVAAGGLVDARAIKTTVSERLVRRSELATALALTDA